MKRIIDGRRYNTDTAEELAQTSYGNAGDFGHYWEGLYRSPRGAYFLYGHGGARSHYAVSLGQNSWGGGSAIVPISAREAVDWLERHGETEILESEFAEYISDA